MIYAVYFSVIICALLFAYLPKIKIKDKEIQTLFIAIPIALIILTILNLTLPNVKIDPIAFSIGSLEVHWYALWILLGVALALFHGIREGRKLGIASDLIYTGIIFILPLSVIGARVWYVLFNLDQFNSFSDALGLTGGWSGLAIQGGVIVAIISVVVYCKITKISLYKAFDILAPGLIIGQIFGRWGNFCNHELYGPLIQNVNAFEIIFPRFITENMYITGSDLLSGLHSGYYQPMFLYESCLNLLGLVLYFVLRRKFSKIESGDSLGLYLLWYGIVRTITESFRFEGEVLLLGNIRVSILISVIFMVLGIGFLVLKRFLPNRKKYIDIIEYISKNKVDTILFDLDGTLLDSKALIYDSFYHVFDKYFPTHELTNEELDSFFGPTLVETFSKYTSNKELIDELVNYYREFNIANHDEYVKLFPGVKDTIKYLHKRHYKLGVVSSKKTDLVYRALDLFNIRDYFDIVIGADDVKKHKPDPEGILLAKKELEAKNVLYVGDSTGDIKAGKYANVKTCAVIYDLNSVRNASIVDALPDKVIYKMYDLIKYIGD